MTQDELTRSGFISEVQHASAVKALADAALPPYKRGFYAPSMVQAPCCGADYSRPAAGGVFTFPAAADLSGGMLPPFDQGERGTCMANAVVGLAEYYFENRCRFSRQYFYLCMKQNDGSEERLKKWLRDPAGDEGYKALLNEYFKKYAGHSFSEKYICDLATEDYRDSFEGAGFENAYKTLTGEGLCREELMPYAPVREWNSVCQMPAEDPELRAQLLAEHRNDALNHRIKDKACILPGRAIGSYKQQLSGSNGRRPMPLVIALQTFKSLFSDFTRETGWWSCPLENDIPTGGHAMLVTGYRDVPEIPGGGYLIVRNSWGSQWAWNYPGHAGYARIPYAYVEHYGYSQTISIEAAASTGDAEEIWPPVREKIDAFISTAPRMMRNRQGLFNIAAGESIIVDPATGVADKDTPENRRIFTENGFSWNK